MGVSDDSGARDPELARRAAQLQHAMSRAPAGSRQRRFLRRAAERARRRASGSGSERASSAAIWRERTNAPGHMRPGAFGSPRS
ncbi:MAG: hypothetical protein JWQ48_1921 [Conexibacter sp.]|jgi:hypothetical protein|nr:hypothetical protein [Conexibacter sp.]